MTERATSWSITINNPGPADEEAIALARQKGWKVEGQLEKGQNGTPHYQLMVKTPQVRFSALKKQFPRAHIEVARNAAALANYVHKEETREAALSTSQDKYPSLSKYWQLIYKVLSDDGPAEYEHDWDRMQDKAKLDLLDEASYRLIYDGYHVETLAVNPQTRAAFAKFARAILVRAYADSQTDRQPVHAAETIIQEINIPNASVSEEDYDTPPSSDVSPSRDGLPPPCDDQIQSSTVIC